MWQPWRPRPSVPLSLAIVVAGALVLGGWLLLVRPFSPPPPPPERPPSRPHDQVQWQPWGQPTLARAQAENKPLFLLLDAWGSADQRLTWFYYNPQNRLCAQLDAAGVLTQQAYDANGNLAADVDAPGWFIQEEDIHAMMEEACDGNFLLVSSGEIAHRLGGLPAADAQAADPLAGGGGESARRD